MHRRQPLPRLWLMTDERQGEGLWAAIDRLPPGSGIIFRHHGLARRERAMLIRQVRARAKRKSLLLLVAGSERNARRSRADGWHGRSPQRPNPGLVRTAPVHNLREIRAAERAGADLLFLSPVFPTRSHPGKRALGPARFMLLAHQARVPVIALGGMDGRRARRLGKAIYGWAGIDAWTRPSAD